MGGMNGWVRVEGEVPPAEEWTEEQRRRVEAFGIHEEDES